MHCGVEAQVLHCVDQSGEESEEFGSDSNTVAETPFEGAVAEPDQLLSMEFNSLTAQLTCQLVRDIRRG